MKKHSKVLPIIIVILLIILYAVINVFIPKIELQGKDKINLTVGKDFKDPGYSAYLRFKKINNKISTKTDLNEDKTGTYYIDYYIKFGPLKINKRRTINVIDNVKPEIKVEMDNKNYYVCPGKELKEVKFKATDNYDGDITKKVNVDIEKDQVTFSVKDKNKNETKITKDIYYVDINAPKIELNSGDVTVIKGAKYNELGAKATDDCDGDVTDKIKINNNINVNAPGNYEVVYEIEDKAKNKNTVKRKVKVIEANRGVIYLTFDDGPQEGTTNVILDILKEEGVKATFFVTNKGPDSLIKREAAEGHTVALHTASHDYARIYSSDEAFLADLKSVSDRVLRITGKETKIMRFPGGSSNTISRRYSPGIMSRMTKTVNSMGYHYFDWDVSSGDAAGGSPSPDTIYNNVINSVKPAKRNIVLMHDIKTYTRDALRNIIHWGKDNGYTFVPITMETEEHHQRVNN